MNIKRFLLLGLLVLLAVPFVMADALTLKDGRTITGTYLGGTSSTVRFRTEGVIRTYRVTEVDRVDFGDTTSTYPSTSSTYPSTTPSASSERYGAHTGTHTDDRAGRHSGTHTGVYSTDPSSPNYAQRVGVRDEYVIPSGTTLRVRTNETIDSDNARVGDTFNGTLDQDIFIGNQLLAERGSPVKLRIAEVDEGGTLSGRKSLVIDLVELSVNGAPYALTTAPIEQKGSSRTRQSQTVIGGGAALGAIIGAIAGGAKGAVVGAVVGGAGGAGYQILTKGAKLKIPAETVLEFTMQRDLYVRR
ncbi:MAG TPA: hypothetical protein VGK99_18205 [Acidobacteriota bacterium]|jgi:hypothetical protein